METLATFLVGRPLNILLIALVVTMAYVVVRLTGVGSERHPRALLVVAAAWAMYATWEWLVVTRTPEANIRVDLMLIWPILLILSIGFGARAFRRVPPA